MEALDRLMSCLARLPGTGRRSAERMALRLARDTDTLLLDLIRALQEVKENVRCCSRCGNVTPVHEQPCRLCAAPDRENQVLCVVEDPDDIMILERSKSFRGRYHSLMGRISPMRGEGPGDVRIRELLRRVDEEGVEEVILALSTDVEGDATASLITELLKGKKVKVSRLAFGLPVGSGISYADPVTLARAIKGRQAT